MDTYCPANLALIKCNCGDKNCDYYGLNDGNFPQGSGWDKETAEHHLRAIKSNGDLLCVLKRTGHILSEIHAGNEFSKDQIWWQIRAIEDVITRATGKAQPCK